MGLLRRAARTALRFVRPVPSSATASDPVEPIVPSSAPDDPVPTVAEPVSAELVVELAPNWSVPVPEPDDAIELNALVHQIVDLGFHLIESGDEPASYLNNRRYRTLYYKAHDRFVSLGLGDADEFRQWVSRVELERVAPDSSDLYRMWYDGAFYRFLESLDRTPDPSDIELFRSWSLHVDYRTIGDRLPRSKPFKFVSRTADGRVLEWPRDALPHVSESATIPIQMIIAEMVALRRAKWVFDQEVSSYETLRRRAVELIAEIGGTSAPEETLDRILAKLTNSS